MISLESVTKLYGSVIGANDVSFALPPGAFGLLGPNGSGKSTLLNLITGQIRPTLGRLSVLGGNPAHNREVLRQIGYCPETDVLYANISAIEWVCYLLRLQGFGRAEAKRRAETALEQVGMSEAMRRAMGGYSRGMRQRVKLAQAVAHDPAMLVLDEPLNGLDPVARFEMTTFLRRWAVGERLLLMASHVLHEVEAVTGTFMLIYGGRLLASGSAGEIQELLAGAANEIRIRCDRPLDLARRALAQNDVTTVRLGDDGSLVLGAACPAAVFAGLPQWIGETGVEVYEVQCRDDSLQNLFAAILRLHRGAV